MYIEDTIVRIQTLYCDADRVWKPGKVNADDNLRLVQSIGTQMQLPGQIFVRNCPLLIKSLRVNGPTK